MKTLRIGTRGSKLALVQAEYTRTLVQEYNPGIACEIVIIRTTGDINLSTPLAEIGDKGLFTKEIENALLNHEIDVAVHSLKDLPTLQPDGLSLGAVAPRKNPADAFISRTAKTLQDLPQNAVIATGSLRRRVQLLHFRPDFQIVDIRGNVDTRLTKFDESNWDGMLLAFAGMSRMNLEHRITSIIPMEILLPAVGQGAIGLQTRTDDSFALDCIAQINHPKTNFAVSAERAFLQRLEGGCRVPIGALGTVNGTTLQLEGMICSLDGKTMYRSKMEDEVISAENLGIRLAEELLSQGGDKILGDIRL